MNAVNVRYPAEPLTPAEIGQLLRGCSDSAPTGIRNRALIVVMWRCGLRVSEALDLKPADIDTANGTVRVLDGKGHMPRTVGLGLGELAVVQRWMDHRPAHRGAPLFCTLRGARMQSAYVRALMKRLAAKAGLEKRVHPHGLRHTYAAELSREGNAVNVIQKALGHKNLATTAVYLNGISPQDVIEMAHNRPPMVLG